MSYSYKLKAEKVDPLIRQLGYTRQSFSEAIGYNSDYMTDALGRNNNVSEKALYKIADRLKVSTKEIVEKRIPQNTGRALTGRKKKDETATEKDTTTAADSIPSELLRLENVEEIHEAVSTGSLNDKAVLYVCLNPDYVTILTAIANTRHTTVDRLVEKAVADFLEKVIHLD